MNLKNPRTVRNFWAELTVDGYAKPFGAGPRKKDGGLYVTLYQRDSGQVTRRIDILCTVLGNGDLQTRITSYAADGTREPNDQKIITKR